MLLALVIEIIDSPLGGLPVTKTTWLEGPADAPLMTTMVAYFFSCQLAQ
jgi:hypothetical protein